MPTPDPTVAAAPARLPAPWAVRPPSQRTSAALATLVLSWAVLAAAPWIAALVPWRSLYEPSLPSVGAVPWNPRGDFMSSVPALFQVLLLSGLAALLVEIPKALLPRGRWRSYLLLLTYQLALMADGLRTYAFDWWVWLLYWLGLRSTGLESSLHAARPWPSLLAMIALATFLWLGGEDDTSVQVS